MSKSIDFPLLEDVELAARVNPTPVPTPAWPDTGSPSTRVGLFPTVILAILLFVELVAIGLLYVPIAPNPDHEVYDYMAWSAITHGGMYRNGGDMNMPGEPLLHLASMKLFGNHYWSYRLLDYVIFLAEMTGIALLCRRLYGWIFSGLFLALVPLVYTTSGYWMTGQRDFAATHAILLAGFVYARRFEGGGLGWTIFAGLLMAWAVVLKPTFLAFGPILVVLMHLLSRRSIKKMVVDVMTLGVVGALVIGALVLLGWATGSLQAWREMTFTYSLQQYVGGKDLKSIVKAILDVTFFLGYSWFTLMAIAGLISLTVEGRSEPLSVVLAVIATVLISAFAQGKGFGYHIGPVFSVMSLLCAFYLTEIVRLTMRIHQPRLRIAVISFPLILIFGNMASKSYREFQPQLAWYLGRSSFVSMIQNRKFDDVMESSKYIESKTKPDETVWNNSLHLMINSLADRSFPGRLISYAMIRFDKPSELAQEWRREVEEIFQNRPPRCIILQIGLTNPDELFNMTDIKPHEPISVLKQELDKNYTRDRQIGRFIFYFRNSPTGSSTPG